jgi:phage replication-related protein YjqB (UPF0714/DUF867 family)
VDGLASPQQRASLRQSGVEISLALRRALFADVTTRKGRGRTTESFARLVGAMRQALFTYKVS